MRRWWVWGAVGLVLLCANSVCAQAVYDAQGHVLYGYNRFGRSQTVWSTDLKTLKVARVSAGATQTVKGVPFKTALELVVRPSALAVVTRVAIQAGLMAGSSYLIPWLADQALNWFFDSGTNQVMLPGGVTTENNPLNLQTYTDYVGGGTGTFCIPGSGWVTVNVVAYGALSSMAWSGFPYSGGLCTYGQWCNEPFGGNRSIHHQVYTGQVAGCTGTYKHTWYVELEEGAAGDAVTGEAVAVPWGTVDDALEADFLANRQNGYELARDATAAVGAGVEEQNKNWPTSGPDSPGNGLSPEQGAEIQTALNGELTQDQKDKLANNEVITSYDPNDPYGGWEDWEYSPNEIATAIEEHLRPYLEPGEVTLESEGEPPDKDSLPEVLDEFHDGVSSWEGLTLLNSLTLETTSASCNFCIDKPEILGLSGQVCYDCCPHEPLLSGLGNMLFGIMALCWLFWIFM